MKKTFLLLMLLLPGIISFACPACESQQPKILRGITHGEGPSGPLDYILGWIMVAIVLVTLYYSVKWLIKPEEKSPDHIKRLILNND